MKELPHDRLDTYGRLNNNPKMNLTKNKNNHYLLAVMTSGLMLEAEKKITRKKCRSSFHDLDKALADSAKIVSKNVTKCDGLLG